MFWVKLDAWIPSRFHIYRSLKSTLNTVPCLLVPCRLILGVLINKCFGPDHMKRYFVTCKQSLKAQGSLHTLIRKFRSANRINKYILHNRTTAFSDPAAHMRKLYWAFVVKIVIRALPITCSICYLRKELRACFTSAHSHVGVQS